MEAARFGKSLTEPQSPGIIAAAEVDNDKLGEQLYGSRKRAAPVLTSTGAACAFCSQRGLRKMGMTFSPAASHRRRCSTAA